MLKNNVIQQNKTPHEELKRHKMKIQEVSGDITSWGESYPKSQEKFERTKHTKRQRKTQKRTGN